MPIGADANTQTKSGSLLFKPSVRARVEMFFYGICDDVGGGAG